MLLNLLFILVAVPINAFAADGDVYKEKTISKVYLVNSNAGIDIRNKYGSIYVTTWDEDKIGIEVVIKVHGKNESIVTKRINSINVEINPLTNLVSAKTIVEEMSGNKISLEINYTIKMPKAGSVKLNNKYGSIIADRVQGRAEIDCQYGSITLGELLSGDNLISIQYCSNSTIAYLKNGVVDAKYSDLKIIKSGNLNYKSEYSDLALKEVNNITYKSIYSDLTIVSSNNINGNGDYLTLKFGTILNNCNIVTEYSNISVNAITPKTNNVAITCEYTNIDIRYDSDYSFVFEFNFKFGDLSASGLNFQTKREDTGVSYYKGYYKNNNSSNRMNINSKYGNLKLIKI